MPDNSRGPPATRDLIAEVACGGISTATVSAALNPVDVVKTRRQLERFSERRAVEIAQSLWAEGGAAALWRPGLAATIAREIVYSGCTKGLYPVMRDAISGDADPNLPQRVAAASATGFGGISMTVSSSRVTSRSTVIVSASSEVLPHSSSIISRSCAGRVRVSATRSRSSTARRITARRSRRSPMRLSV